MKATKNAFSFSTKTTCRFPVQTFKFMTATLVPLKKWNYGFKNVRHSQFLKHHLVGVCFLSCLLCVVLCIDLLKRLHWGNGGE